MKRAIAVFAVVASLMAAGAAQAGTTTFNDPAGDTALLGSMAVSQGDPTVPAVVVPGLKDPSVDILAVQVGTVDGYFIVTVKLADVDGVPKLGSKRTVTFQFSGDQKNVPSNITVPLPGGPLVIYGNSTYWLWTIYLRAHLSKPGATSYSMEIVSNATPGKPGDTVSYTTPVPGVMNVARNEIHFSIPITKMNSFIHAHTTEPPSTFAPGVELRELAAMARYALPIIEPQLQDVLLSVGVDYAEGPNTFTLP
jgi:hypothetical protein